MFTSTLDWLDFDSRYAFLATYQFDPVFFERVLLRTRPFKTARRILVLVDHREWTKTLVNRLPVSLVNTRYLVVPILVPKGVFHPKLFTFLSEDSATLICGSCNLTRSGFTHNLELVNRLPLRGGNLESALDFYSQSLGLGFGDWAVLAQDWLLDARDEIALDEGFDKVPPDARLIHSFGESLWSQLLAEVGDQTPQCLLVVSPFYDRELTLLKQWRQRWPECAVEFVAQQHTSTLPPDVLLDYKNVRLYDLEERSRTLHGKLVAWKADNGQWTALTGSPNFTFPAFHGRNVETGLVFSLKADPRESLFGKDLLRLEANPGDFTPARLDDEVVASNGQADPLLVHSVWLDATGKLHCTFSSDPPLSDRTTLLLRQRHRSDPDLALVVDETQLEAGRFEVRLEREQLAGFRGAILVSLSSQTDHGRLEGPPVWLADLRRLTRDKMEDQVRAAEQSIQTDGEGLVELLMLVGRTDGSTAVCEYLSRLNIRYSEGKELTGKSNRFHVKLHDAFRADELPEWVLKGTEIDPNIPEAIFNFFDRHFDQKLQKHVRYGKLTGMNNLRDIFLTLAKLLVAFREGLSPDKICDRLCNLVQLVVWGFECGRSKRGYLEVLADNLKGQPDLLRARVLENNLDGHLRAALLLAQLNNWDVAKPPARRLKIWMDHLFLGLQALGLRMPARSRVATALEDYRLWEESEVNELLDAL